METLIDEILTLSEREAPAYSIKDFKSDQDVRWCPGCGDYAILSQMQKLLPELHIPKERIVFISGIGCSSRFPYYMDTYGFHTIHGRAPSIATGLKISRPELSIWVITGDGDSLSIGGNHTIHLLRRNLNVNVLLFNNEIYGLTKGQFSPTSHVGQVTKSTPLGSLDSPFNPISLALGADGTFVARTLDRDLKHMGAILKEAAMHKGTSFVEIYQNCVVFNDGAFEEFTDKKTKQLTTVTLEHGSPLIFGANNELGIRLDGFTPTVVNLEEGHYSAADLLHHDKHDRMLAYILARMSDMPGLPRPVGIFYQEERSSYEELVQEQEKFAFEKFGEGNLEKLLFSGDCWEVR